MKRTKVSRVVTGVILGLVLLFAGLILWTYLDGGPTAAPPGASGGGPGAPPMGGPGGGGPGAPPGGGTAQRPGGQSGGAAGGGTAGRNATVVRVSPVALGTIENSVVINGDVLARTQVSIYPTVAGRLTELLFRVGDSVRQGQTVAMVDPSRPGEVYSQSPVVSTISGTVLQAPVNPGDTLSVQTPVYVVGDLAGLRVETFVPERFSTAVRQGLPAQVSFEAMPGEVFAAVVDEVSPVLDPASRTLRIRLRFTAPDPRIRAGMFATVSLVTNARTNVPLIPRTALINTYGTWIVFVADEDHIARRRTVELGLDNEELVEISAGLALGERVITAGQNFLSDNEPIRVVD